MLARLVFFNFFLVSQAGHIGLFASTGAYSHDMLMRNMADRLHSTTAHRVTIIQTRVFEFNRTLPVSNGRWDYVSFNVSSDEATSIQYHLQRLMWLVTLPFDGNTFDIRSVRALNKIHSIQLKACFKALRDQRFINEIKKLDLDLLVIDYVMNECAIGLAYAIKKKVKVIYMSNYPIVSCYIGSISVSSNPAYIPAVIGAEKVPMNLIRRIFNTFMYGVLWAFRINYYSTTRRLFKLAIDAELPSLNKLERNTIMFATPFELLLDNPRPLVNSLRYFGCEHCWRDQNIIGNITQTLGLPVPSSGFILVSFGTVTKGDRIPLEQLAKLFITFSKFPQYTIIWQLDSSRAYYERALMKIFNSTALPSHIHIFSWLPLRTLLTDPRVALLVSHGGVTTCIEAVNSGVPVLGIAIQGDQMYNLQRFVEKGVGECLQVSKLSQHLIYEKMALMIRENERYKKAARKLQAMLKDYKSLEPLPSSFWLNWTVRHYGQSDSNRVDRFVRSKHPSNWLVYYSLDIIVTTACLMFFLAYLISIFV